VQEILLADGWHHVDHDTNGDSLFDIDAYEFKDSDELVFRGGECPLVASAGFSFMSHDVPIVGPLTAILAIRMEGE
jgi:hypothetical protein